MIRFYISAFALVAACAMTQVVPAQAHFLRGDSNHDKNIDIADGISTLGWLFLGTAQPPCLDAADVNDTGDVDIADAIYTLNFLFTGGPPPAAPWPVFEADPTPDELGCLGPPVEVVGDITADTTWTRDKVYMLTGGTFVRAPATLTIQEGTTILGKKGDALTAGVLVIDRGAKIMAVGTSTHPVVFTSAKPVGSRGKADWGGLILLGRATINVTGGEAKAEGLPDNLYGGGANPDDHDSSGQLSYVRLEYGGIALSLNNEINGLSMFAIGDGTKIDHIQTKYADDDSYEWFGGTVRAKYLLATGNTDDNLDYSFGFRGALQFVVAHQNKDDTQASGNGFEVDNSEAPVGQFTDLPTTNPMISNVTMVGPGDPAAPNGGQGVLLRRGCAGRIYNVLVQGWRKGSGFDIDDAITTTHINLADPAHGDFVFDYSSFFDNGADGNTNCQAIDSETGAQKEDDPANNFLDTSCHFITTTMQHNTFSTSSLMVDPYNLTGPNFKPQGDALTNPFDPTTLDGSFFEPAPYRGGVSPTGEDWTQAPWISYQRN